MFQLALLAGGAAVVAFAVTRALRTRFASRKDVDLGVVSDGWLAAQRAAKTDS